MSCLVHILADDAVANWLVLFLESFVRLNPEHAIVIVPYSDQMARTERIAAAYGVPIGRYDFSEIDAFAGAHFRDPAKRGRLRKLVAFDADVDVSLYIDIDVIVTGTFPQNIEADPPVDLVFGTQSGNNVYNIPATPEVISKRSKFFSSGLLLIKDPKSWVSSTRILSFINENIDEYLTVRAPYVIDQPILNYYVDRCARTALVISAVWPGLSPHNWYKDPVLRQTERGLRDKYDREVLFIHWAGEEKNSGELTHFADLRQELRDRVHERFGAGRTALGID